MSNYGLSVKENVVYKYNGMLLSLIREESLVIRGNLTNLDDIMLKRHKLVTEGQILYDSTLHKEFKIVKHIGVESMVVNRKWKEEKMGRCCSVGIELSYAR